MNRLALRLLTLLHAFGINAAIVAGLLLTPAVVAVGYLTNQEEANRDEAGGAPITRAELRGSFDAFADDGAPEKVRAVDVRRRPDPL